MSAVCDTGNGIAIILTDGCRFPPHRSFFRYNSGLVPWSINGPRDFGDSKKRQDTGDKGFSCPSLYRYSFDSAQHIYFKADKKYGISVRNYFNSRLLVPFLPWI